ncbi:MAG: glycosyltransferase family 9 protein [Phycisphaerales bacterium]|jgi:ADP-heptose:LPS heptosyltransferase
MRILISNPDTIGDVVLREPLFRALAEAGHELALVVSPLVQPMARAVAPTARLIELPINVYDGKLDADDERLDDVVEAAEAFDPEVLVGAPFTWTILEERLCEAFPKARRIGQAGGKFLDSEFSLDGATPVLFDEVVRVNEDLHELRKSEALARAVLNAGVYLDEPRLVLNDELQRSADAVLARLELKRGSFLAACVGHQEYTAVRNWRPERWAEALAHWMVEYDRPVLLLGAQGESEVARTIGDALEAKGLEPRHWFGGPEGDTLLLAALLDASRAYVGKDTGPMHMAAALGKPVLAVFGGGTWPRFRPLVKPSVSITLAVPCSPCDWRCEQRRSHCVKDVPVSAVTAQIDRFENGEVEGADVVQIEPSRAMLVGMAGDAARAAKHYRAELSIARRSLKKKNEETREKAMSDNAVMQRLDKLEQVLRNSRSDEAERRASEVTQKLTQNTQALEQARRELASAVERADTANQATSSLKAEIEQLRTQLEQSRQRLHESESRAAEAEKTRDKAAMQRDAAEREAAELRAKYAGVDLPKLRADLSKARRLVGALQGENNDLKLRADQRLEERRAMEKLADQRLVAVQNLENKLGELLASRWRQMGQRLHVAMVLPWEEAERRRLLGTGTNGQH